MTYLIYNEEGDLIDVMNFETNQERIAYEENNPNHILYESDDELDDDLIDDEDDLFDEGDEEIYDDDDIDL